jgi:hypothetical protein
MTNWYIRIHDGKNFKASMKKGLWACKSFASDGKCFLSNAVDGDQLWFILGKPYGGEMYAVATFVKTMKRETGPLISVTMTDEEIGWEAGPNGSSWDTEIHFRDLYIIESLHLVHNAKCQSSIFRVRDSEIDLDTEYTNIVKYCGVVKV